MHRGTWLDAHLYTTAWFNSLRQPPTHLDEVLVLTYVHHATDADVRLPYIRIAQVSVKPGWTPRILFKCVDGERLPAADGVLWRPLPDVPEKIAEKMRGEFMSLAKLLARCCDEPTLLKEKAELSVEPTVSHLQQVAIINDALTIIYNGRKRT